MTRKDLPKEWLIHDAKIKPYLWSLRISGFLMKIVGVIFLYDLCFNKGRTIENFITFSGFLKWWLYFFIIGLSWEIISFPFSLCFHSIERHFGLSKQTYLKWLWDYVKMQIVSILIGTIALLAFYVPIRLSSINWWLYSSTIIIFFTIFLAKLSPIILIPIFFKLKPLEEGSLKIRLLNLANKFNINVKEIYHIGLEEKTEKANAMFSGIGKTKKILLGDTLYKNFSEDEVEAVFAHELGHRMNNDIWKSIVFSSFFVILSFFIAYLLTNPILEKIGSNFAMPYGIFIFFVIVSIIQIPLNFIHLIIQRNMEKKADLFALKNAPPRAFASALERLAFKNYALFKPHPLIEFFFYSHPAPWRRILLSRNF